MIFPEYNLNCFKIQPSNMSRSNDLLVVGAGPVGLMMAAELRRHGVACRLIERLEKPAPHCKALGVTPRTLEVWDDLGVVQQALSAGLGLKGAVNLTSGDVYQQEKVGVALPDGAYGFLVLAQYDTERILTDHLRSLGGQIERGVELTALEQTDSCVSATLKHADGSAEQVECQYLLGCDGGRSAVRRALNVPFEGEHYEQTFFLVDVELSGDLERGYAYRMVRIEKGQPVGGGACIPVPGNPRRYRFSTVAPEAMLPAELNSGGQPTHGIADIGPTLEQAQELLGWFFPANVKASNLRWSAFYRISHRLAAKYRIGRVFLAGDAAHLHPPIGGQGMNTGLQDAYNLAWKLALHVHGLASANLLDSYEAERRPIGQQIVERTTKRMNKMFQGKVDEQEPIREDSQLFLNYRGSPWIGGDSSGENSLPLTLGEGRGEGAAPGPLPGHRAPDVCGLQRAFTRHEFRLFDLLRGPHHTLLLYTASADPAADCQRFAAIAAALFQQFAGRIQTYAIIHSDCDVPEIEGLPTVVDRRNEFGRIYRPSSGSGFLIRPDGYVGYRAEQADLDRLRAYLKRTFRD
ncbi:MAG TPA: FAD-dependent monooxygenase [Pirellulales bacterium]|nr:FAD-dependent monooxygenase [Pirellulales bacterium]